MVGVVRPKKSGDIWVAVPVYVNVSRERWEKERENLWGKRASLFKRMCMRV
jgi:hypothetical protein